MPASPDPTPKREAETALSARPSKRRRSSVPNTLTCPSSPFPTLTQTPEPSSINAILQQYPRSRLYVTPLHWTSRQLQLLGCHYASQEPRQDTDAGPEVANAPTSERCRATPSPQARATATPSTEAAIAAAKFILTTRSPGIKTAAVYDLLEIHGVLHYARATATRPPRPRALYNSFDLPLYFRQRVATTLRTDGVFSRSSSPSVPCLGYLDLESLGERRDKSVKLSHRRSGPNWPIARLRKKYQSRIRPPNELEDPFIMASLIALAQLRRCKLSAEGRGGEAEAEASEVHLLALATDSRSLYFYTARVPIAFLDGFDHPSHHIPGSSFSVAYHHIPLTPKPKFLREMGWVLPAICGDMAGTLPTDLGRETELGAENPDALAGAGELVTAVGVREQGG